MSPRKLKSSKVAYRCCNYLNAGGSVCSSHHIREEDLLKIVQADLLAFAFLSEDQRRELIGQILMEEDGNSQEQKKHLELELKRLSKREQDIVLIIQSLYEDKLKGNIDQDMFSSMAANYQQEKSECLTSLDQIKLKLAAYQNVEENLSEWEHMLDQYLQLRELDYTLARQLIERIEIGESEAADGSKYQIDITYRFGNHCAGLPDNMSKKETA